MASLGTYADGHKEASCGSRPKILTVREDGLSSAPASLCPKQLWASYEARTR